MDCAQNRAHENVADPVTRSTVSLALHNLLGPVVGM